MLIKGVVEDVLRCEFFFGSDRMQYHIRYTLYDMKWVSMHKHKNSIAD